MDPEPAEIILQQMSWTSYLCFYYIFITNNIWRPKLGQVYGLHGVAESKTNRNP